METKAELKKLNELKSIDAEKFEAQYLFIKENFTSQEDMQFIDKYIFNMLSESEERVDTFINLLMQKNAVTHDLSTSKILTEA